MEHRDPGPDTPARPVAALRALLNGWDPIGVVEHGAPDDEYDCLIAPVLDLVEAGAASTVIAGFLRAELRDHFGLEPGEAGIVAVSRAAADLRVRR